MSTNAIRVAVTGAAGQIGYSLLYRIAAGEVFGPNQPVILHLIEVDVPEILERLKGTVMEIEDCAFPLLKGIVATGNLDEGFKDVNWCLLVGAAPRKAGGFIFFMETDSPRRTVDTACSNAYCVPRFRSASTACCTQPRYD